MANCRRKSLIRACNKVVAVIAATMTLAGTTVAAAPAFAVEGTASSQQTNLLTQQNDETQSADANAVSDDASDGTDSGGSSGGEENNGSADTQGAEGDDANGSQGDADDGAATKPETDGNDADGSADDSADGNQAGDDASDGEDGIMPLSVASCVQDGSCTVQGMTPAGMQMNLFDYWNSNSGQTTSDRSDPTSGRGTDYTQGINNGHSLKFSANNGNAPGYTSYKYNSWTGRQGGPFSGIVNTKLTNGYPTLSQSKTGSSESLDYLFDPNKSNVTGRKSYTSVKDLLQIDGDGYYYYDSNKNYAKFNGYSDSSKNDFTLYNSGAISTSGYTTTHQFFPMQDDNFVNRLFTERNGTLTPTRVTSGDSSANHYFGMTMSSRFVQPDNGKIVRKDGTKDMTFRFTGDDDAWVFIDGVLVGDVGGIHDAAGVEINFATGWVTIGKYLNSSGVMQSTSTTTLRALFNAAGVSGTNWNGNTFVDGTYHTIDFFYLERGNGDSNLSLKFNIETVPTSNVLKVDQTGNIIPGVGFDLYVVDENNARLNSGQAIATGTTDSNGQFVFVDSDGEIISFDDLYTRNNWSRYELVEQSTPTGYRKIDSIYCNYTPSPLSNTTILGGHVTVDPDSQWKTGAYAVPGLTVKAPWSVHKRNSDGSQGSEISNDDLKNGTMFALVFKKKANANSSDASSWQAVTGDSLHGLTMHDISDMDSVAALVSEHAESLNKTNAFVLESSGAYELSMPEIPGEQLHLHFHWVGN